MMKTIVAKTSLKRTNLERDENLKPKKIYVTFILFAVLTDFIEELATRKGLPKWICKH